MIGMLRWMAENALATALWMVAVWVGWRAGINFAVAVGSGLNDGNSQAWAVPIAVWSTYNPGVGGPW